MQLRGQDASSLAFPLLLGCTSFFVQFLSVARCISSLHWLLFAPQDTHLQTGVEYCLDLGIHSLQPNYSPVYLAKRDAWCKMAAVRHPGGCSTLVLASRKVRYKCKEFCVSDGLRTRGRGGPGWVAILAPYLGADTERCIPVRGTITASQPPVEETFPLPAHWRPRGVMLLCHPARGKGSFPTDFLLERERVGGGGVKGNVGRMIEI